MSIAAEATIYGIARERLFHHLTAAGSSGALLTGGVGVGKNWIAQEVIHRLPPGVPVHRIQASPSLKDTDLGALALLLGSSAQALTMAQAISRLRSEIGASMGVGIHTKRHESLPLLVVDRAEYLDPATGFVLAQLAQSRSVRLLLIGSTSGWMGARLEPVLSSGHLAVISLDGLGEDGLADMCSKILSGPVSAGTVKAFQRLSGGLPPIAEACVRAARDQGVLSRREGTWVLGSEDLSGHHEVENAVLGLQGQWQGTTAEALLVLALAGPQHGKFLNDVFGADPDLLRDTGLVHTGLEGRLALRSPVHAQVLRRTTLPGISTTLFHRWAGARPEPWDSRQTWWAVSCAAKIEPERICAAVKEANERGEFEAALQLSEVPNVAEHGPTKLEKIRALEGLGRLGEARAAIEAHIVAGGRELPDAEASAVRHLSVLLSSDASAADLRTAALLWESLLERRPGATIRACIDSSLLVADWREGIVPRDTPTRIRSIVDCGDGDVEVGILGVAASHLMLQGQDLLTVFSPLRPAVAKASPLAARRLLTHLAAVLTLDGHRSELEETLELMARVPGATRFGHHDLIAFFNGWQQIREGGVDDGRRRLKAAIPGLQAPGLDEFEVLARRLTGQIPSNGPNVSKRPAAAGQLSLLGRLVELLEVTRDSPAPASREKLERLIAAYRSEGHQLLEIEALVEGLGLEILGSDGRPTREPVERLLELVSSRRGEWPASVARVARSWLSNDHRVWLATATALETSSYPGLALIAWARVVVGSEMERSATQRGLALRRLHALQSSLGHAVLPVVRRALEAGELTEREEEILKHASVGLSNREIARELTLSQRTVEGHLYRIFAKLGVSDRTELVQFA